MSEQTKFNLKTLLESYNVVIPLIQRDYAQGRLDVRTTDVRKKLLQDINTALTSEDNLPLDLNFIYGKSSNGQFIPLDGQQRLTTLFLVYLYAFRNSESCDFLRNFSYETRDSSKQFFTSLFEFRKDIFETTVLPSEFIKDASWFADSWLLDPTVQGTLVTLDEITEQFHDDFDYEEILSKIDGHKVVFNFLDIDELGSEDELYIKLNSRGRPLTDFENFKARFISRLHIINGELASSFTKNLDTKWTDTVWKIDKDKFDINFLNLFEIALINNLDSLDYSERENWTSKVNFETINLEHVDLIVGVLEFLSENKYPDVSSTLVKAIENKSLKSRVYFHVISKFILHNGLHLDNSFEKWYRIFRNLIDNSDIDYQAPYERAINGINEQIPYMSDLLGHLSEGNRISGFNYEQVSEEIEKAKLIITDKSLKALIFRAEEHPYFSGQIRSCFFFESDDSLIYKRETISHYWNKISNMFDNNKAIEGRLLRVALLSLGDYTLNVDSYKTLCQDDPNESSSTPSLKKLFSSRNIFVKRILDEINLDKGLKNEYIRIVSENSGKIDSHDWRYAFIENYELMFNKMAANHYRLKSAFSANDMIMITNKNSRAKNTDIHLLALMEELKKYGIYSTYESELGLWTPYRYIYIHSLETQIYFKDNFFLIENEDHTQHKLIDPSERTPSDYKSVAKYLSDFNSKK